MLFLRLPIECLNTLECLLNFVLLGTEGDTDVALAIGAEDKAWGDEHTGFVKHTLRQFLDIIILLRNLASEEHTHLSGVVGAT